MKTVDEMVKCLKDGLTGAAKLKGWSLRDDGECRGGEMGQKRTKLSDR